ncbi:hypothetical protein [Pantoea sp.]|uniref:hypothetical protein n=1 Tax=Pantoea sp. TaxID=69393 RepID=UPI0028B090DF|nr:hypothetical protein [Pantoea sp.]
MNNWPILTALLCCLVLIGCDNKKITGMIVPHVIKSTESKNNAEGPRLVPAHIDTGAKNILSLERIFSMPENLYISFDAQNVSS